MWKKILLVVLVLAAIFAGFMGYAFYKFTSIDKDAHPFADDTIKAVAAHWKTDDLQSRVHPEFIKAIPQGRKLDDYMVIYAKLGKLKEFETCHMVNAFSSAMPVYRRAVYQCPLQAEKAKATVVLTLEQDAGKPWQVLGFTVNSDYFQELLRK